MAVAVTRAPVRPFARPRSETGFWSWVSTVDHKRIGILYGVTAFLFFLVGGIEALLIRMQLAGPNGKILSAEEYNQLFTMHGTTMIFLVVMPTAAAFGNYFVPILIGARDVAFPRLNAFGYWVFLAGGLFMYSSFLFGHAPNGGWFGYAPQTDIQYSPGHNIDFWIFGLQILGIASLTGAVNLIVTVINMRAPGMSLFRMPIFVWMTLVAQFLLLFAIPVITVALFLLMFDRQFGANFFNAQAGADPLLWQHLFGLFAATYYWWPKFTGWMLNDKLGKLQFWLMLIGFNMTFGPFHILGLQGMPRRIYTYPPNRGWDFWNAFATVGSFIIAVSVLIF